MKKEELNLNLGITIILFFICLIISPLTGCTFKKGKLDIPIIDISRVYPLKEMLLQDIADIEYISLETTDNVLLDEMANITYISDKYIIIWQNRGDIFVFSRNGKILSNFNNRGQGSREYASISGSGVIFDENNEELFVVSNNRILTYSIKGDYQRTLKIPENLNIMMKASVYNFDDTSLLLFDGYYPYRSSNSEKPYMLMSKIDGSIVFTFNIILPERYSNRRYYSETVGGQERFFSETINYISINMNYGKDFIISDISSDTIYSLSQYRELTPILVRNPSVHSSEPRVVWNVQLTTEKFIFLTKTTLDPIASANNIRKPATDLIYEFETGQTSEISILNAEFAMGKWYPPSNSPSMDKNMVADLMQIPRLKSAYEENKLKGDLKEIVSTLDEEDNPIVRIIKFK